MTGGGVAHRRWPKFNVAWADGEHLGRESGENWSTRGRPFGLTFCNVPKCQARNLLQVAGLVQRCAVTAVGVDRWNQLGLRRLARLEPTWPSQRQRCPTQLRQFEEPGEPYREHGE